MPVCREPAVEGAGQDFRPGEAEQRGEPPVPRDPAQDLRNGPFPGKNLPAGKDEVHGPQAGILFEEGEPGAELFRPAGE